MGIDEIEAAARSGLGDRLFGQLLEAIDRCGGTHRFEHVVAGIAAGQYQIIQTERAVIVTEIIDYPTGLRGVSVFLAAGDLDELYGPIIARLEALGREVGAQRLSTIGRPGWARSTQRIGWKPEYVLVTKRLDHDAEQEKTA